jgi:hypothetical protein
MIIKLKIDTKKIEKGRLYVGAKGTYLDCTLLQNRDGKDQYGNDFMIVQDVSKDDREAGIKGAIIGNGKIMESRSTERQKPPATVPKESPIEDDDVPF